ncbi:siderophore-interacting protein [Yinghuangia aomiensis]
MEAFIAAERVQRAQAYRPFHVTVAANRPLSPNATRITFASADLAHLVVGGPDQRVKLFVPRGPGPAPRIAPGAATWRAALETIPEELRPYQRTYTVRAHRPDPPAIDIDFALHDPGGPASRWARNAAPATSWTSWGRPSPATAATASPSLGSHLLLVGDQAALPAVGAVIESLPADARGHAFVSVPTAADIQHLAAPRGVRLTWLPGADEWADPRSRPGHGTAFAHLRVACRRGIRRARATPAPRRRTRRGPAFRGLPGLLAYRPHRGDRTRHPGPRPRSPGREAGHHRRHAPRLAHAARPRPFPAPLHPTPDRQPPGPRTALSQGIPRRQGRRDPGRGRRPRLRPQPMTEAAETRHVRREQRFRPTTPEPPVGHGRTFRV